MRDVTPRLGKVVLNDVANKPITPLDVEEVVRVASKCTVPPFSHKVIHGKVNLVLHGCRLNVMTHGLEKRSPSLPLGIVVQTAYATLANSSHRVPVILRNNIQDWLEVKKGRTHSQNGHCQCHPQGDPRSSSREPSRTINSHGS